jgi:hypothetical protein
VCVQAGFEASGHPAVQPALDLVEDEDQITHEMSLDDKHDPQVINMLHSQWYDEVSSESETYEGSDEVFCIRCAGQCGWQGLLQQSCSLLSV